MGLYEDAAYVDAVRDEVAMIKAEDKVAEEERQKQERLDYIRSVVETMQGAQSLQELKKIHDHAVRRLTARKDDTAVRRIAKELKDLSAKFEEESAA
ncbi:hypothetical protein [Pseudomonas sp. R1-6]|uniref:hypothetical protein n=1 Tax=Pseudomonas sp. R1-6 TaxID=2817397 RepID=UPI003DA876CC